MQLDSNLITKMIHHKYRLAGQQAVVSGPPFRSEDEFALGSLRVKRGEWACPLGGALEATVLQFDVLDLGPIEVELGDRIAAALIKEYPEVTSVLADALRVFTADWSEFAPSPSVVTNDVIYGSVLDAVYVQLQGGSG